MITAKEIEKITTLLARQQPQRAREECHKLLKKQPEHSDLQHLLALCFIAQQRYADAESILLRLLAKKPLRADLHNSLAQLYKVSDLNRAVAYQQKAAELKPSVDHLTNLATLLAAQGFFAKAILAAKQAVLCDNQTLRAQLLLCSLLNKAGRYSEALTQTAALPGGTDYHLLQAEAYIGLNQPQRAAAALTALDIATLSPEQLRFTLTGWLSIGDAEQARQLCQGPAMRKLDMAAAGFLKLKAGTATSVERDKIAAQFSRLNWPLENKAQLAFELAKSYKNDDKPLWLTWLHRANALQREVQPYDETGTLATFEQAIAAIPLLQLADTDNNAEPIFIIGMPRSGTTLVESVLNAHSLGFACGESNALNNVLQFDDTIPEISHQAFFSLFKQPDTLTPAVLSDRGQRYVKQMRQFGTAKHLIDKMPHNFIYTVVLAKLFPQARIIHIKRNPVATILSVYEQAFSAFHSYGNDLATLCRYYKKYQQLMQLSLQSLPPGRVHEISYEQLVMTPEQEIRRLLDYCKLPFEVQCLQFEQQLRSVRTASVKQVRQGIYQSSLTPWHGLETELADVLKAFE